MERLAITAKDIQILTGKSQRHGREIIRNMKVVLNKKPHQYITIEEYCQYADFNKEAALIALRIRKE